MSKPKRNKDDFQIPNKHRIKLDKKDRKQRLRYKSTSNHNLKESPINSDDEEYHQKILSKGQHWWRKVNYRFFRELMGEEVQQFRNRVDGEELLNLKYPAKQLGNYLQEEICKDRPHLTSFAFMNVLFRRETKLEGREYNQIASFGFRQYQTPREQIRQTVSPNLHLDALVAANEDRRDFQVPQEEVFLDAELVEVVRPQQTVLKVLRYDVAALDHEQIDREIILYEKQLNETYSSNQNNWKKMLQRIQTHPSPPIIDPQISSICRDLRMAEVLLYFKRGHSDKTEEMLDQALEIARIKQMSNNPEKQSTLTRLQRLKIIFQTDCKICFCTQSEDKNRVVYCDGCNTSFHQACYGVEELSDQRFYCQVCLYMHRQSSREKDAKTPKKPTCQLCHKQNFPMRQLNNRFYHVTCLVLFDLVQYKNYQIQFRKDINHQKLIQWTVENQLGLGHCLFCFKEAGMKLFCQFPGCGQCYHPICAYLNGVHFRITRTYSSLDVKLTCSEHYPERNYIHQVYLRRFFCDFNGTSSLNDTDFQTKFRNQLQKKGISLQAKQNDRQLGLLRKGKYSKPLRATPLKLKPSQKSESQIKEDEIPSKMTESRKLMLMIAQNNRSN